MNVFLRCITRYTPQENLTMDIAIANQPKLIVLLKKKLISKKLLAAKNAMTTVPMTASLIIKDCVLNTAMNKSI